MRAELGAGNREAALELLERLKERCVADFSFSDPERLVDRFRRQYPEAVYNRISGVLTDYSLPQQ